jgi:hypothetical protein
MVQYLARLWYAKAAQVLVIELCLQCRLIPAQTSIYLFSSPRVYPSMDLTIVLPTDMQNRHDYNAFPLPNSTAHCELMETSDFH